MYLLDTAKASVYGRLRDDIVYSRLLPGERLRTEQLRQRYEVGASPLREALMRLEAEGLVELEQNKGFRVSTVSAEHLADLTRTRIEIEAAALRWSLENGTVEWEGNLVGAFHRLISVPKENGEAGGGHNKVWLHYHRAFHASLVAACNSPILLSLHRRLFDQAERYVALCIAAKGELRDDVGEHTALMEAAVARRVDEAVALNRSHIERTTEKLARMQLLAGPNGARAAR